MSKRHLTKQQQRRIQRNQNKAQAAVDRVQAEALLTTDNLGPEQNGRVTACYGSQVDVEPENAEKFARMAKSAASDMSVFSGLHQASSRDG